MRNGALQVRGFFVGDGASERRDGRIDRGNTNGKVKKTMTIRQGSSDRGLSRRAFLKAGAETAALLGAINTQFPFGVHVAEAAGPEVTKALLGFIALTDAAPLFVAKEKGIFAKHGVPDVEVQKQASWGATRDNLVLGSEGNGIDGAHILTPM